MNEAMNMQMINLVDADVRHEAQILNALVFRATRQTQAYVFADRLRRLSVSMMNGLSGGFDEQDDHELKRRLIVARGACRELRSMLHAGVGTGCFGHLTRLTLLEKSLCLSKMLSLHIYVLSLTPVSKPCPLNPLVNRNALRAIKRTLA